MTTASSVILANQTVCELGEGPVWDAARQQLLWLDIRRGIVFVGRMDRFGRVELVNHVTFPGTVGAVAVAEDGRWIVAGAQHVYTHPDNNALGGIRVIADGQPRRTNDGKADPAGRFVVGTLSLEGTSSEEVLVRLDDDGVAVLDDDLTLSNGFAWSADGATMYSIDTLRRRIYARPYEVESGAVGTRQVFIEVTDGYPDGMCLDAEEHLWIAMWGLGEVHRYTPTGELDRIITVRAPHVSSVAFAGPDLDRLVITTATQDLTPEQLKEYPLSGQLFTAKPGVLGLPVPSWNGSFTTERTIIQ